MLQMCDLTLLCDWDQSVFSRLQVVDKIVNPKHNSLFKISHEGVT